LFSHVPKSTQGSYISFQFHSKIVNWLRDILYKTKIRTVDQLTIYCNKNRLTKITLNQLTNIRTIDPEHVEPLNEDQDRLGVLENLDSYSN
jgi:hypothetical protein